MAFRFWRCFFVRVLSVRIWFFFLGNGVGLGILKGWSEDYTIELSLGEVIVLYFRLEARFLRRRVFFLAVGRASLFTV